MIRVQSEDFDVGAELARLDGNGKNVGGVCSFVGLVRETAGEKKLTAMTLEHYPGMTEKQLADIEAEARSRWPLDEVLIVHRFGRLAPGDRIVLVAASSTHRDAAFSACRFLIDWLKVKAPFWKNEETADGGSQWVKAKPRDDTMAENWKKD